MWAAYLDASGGEINFDKDWLGIWPDEIAESKFVEIIGEHKEWRPPTIIEDPFGLTIVALSPVDLSIVDPDGLIINKQGSNIPEASYREVEVDDNTDLDDLLMIPEPKAGVYLIQVVAEAGASPTDTFTLIVFRDGVSKILAQDVRVEDIPSSPLYCDNTFKSQR